MLKEGKKVAVALLFSLLILSMGFVHSAKGEMGQANAATCAWGKISTSYGLNVRTSANLKAKIVGTYEFNTRVKCLTTGKEWVKVQIGTKKGYAKGQYILLDNGKDATGKKVTTVNKPTASKKVTGSQVVAYAKKFLGNRYVYGGTSLTNGIDCSGFTMKVYEYFGYKIPRTSYTQRTAGTGVASLSVAKPGDLICYSGHVAMYMGNNAIIHASNAKDGIKITYKADYTTILAIRRIIK